MLQNIVMSRVKQELRNFGENTSIRGISRILKSDDKFLKIVWIIAVLACTAVLVFLFVTLFTKFFNWPVTTKFGEDNQGKIVFPDVTVCSLNWFLKFFDKEDIDVYFNIFSQLEKVNSTNYAFEILNSVSGFIVLTDLYLETLNPKLFSECFNLLSECRIYYENWKTYEDCKSYLNISVNYEYGICFTIKTSQLDIIKNRLIRGMSLILNIGTPNLNSIPYEVSLTSSQAHGAAISIHGSGTSPDIKRGFTVGPGTETVVKIVQTNIERQDKPYNAQGCTEQKTLTESPTKAYTFDLCNDHCMQREIIKRCGCVAHWFDIPDTLSDVHLCANISQAGNNYSDYVEKVSCSLTVTAVVSTCEECKLPCKDTSYEYSVTSAPWPPPNYQLSFYRQYIEECSSNNPEIKERFASYEQFQQQSPNSLNVTLADLKEVGESFMVVKLIIESEKPLLLQDKPFYSWDVMVALVGGILSLWLGVTAMTSVELFELFYRIAKCCKKKIKDDNNES